MEMNCNDDLLVMIAAVVPTLPDLLHLITRSSNLPLSNLHYKIHFLFLISEYIAYR